MKLGGPLWVNPGLRRSCAPLVWAADAVVVTLRLTFGSSAAVQAAPMKVCNESAQDALDGAIAFRLSLSLTIKLDLGQV